MKSRRFLLFAEACLIGCALAMPLCAMDDDLHKISELIKAGKPIPRGEPAQRLLSIHEKLTPEDRVKAVKLLEEPDWVLLDMLYESDYGPKEKATLLGELKDREMEFGVEELIVEVANELAETDPDEARKWVNGFSKADFAKGNGLSAVIQIAYDKDPAHGLTMLRDFQDAEAEAVIGYGQLPDFGMSAKDWQAEVNTFQSQRLRDFLLDWPIVFKFARESPQAALNYIESLPPEKRNDQQGRQVVWSLLQGNEYSHSEILRWIEHKLPAEARSDKLYGQVATNWVKEDAESFRKWFSRLQPGPRRDEVIFGFAGHEQPVDWQEAYKLAGTIIDREKRQTKVAWVLGVWQLTDPFAAEKLLEEADITEQRRAHLRRTIESSKQSRNQN